MNKLSKMIRLAYFLVSIAVITVACSDHKANIRQAVAARADSVEVFALKKEPVSKMLKLPAELYPWERSEIYAEVEGYVKELKVDIGDRVRRNDVFVVLDAPGITAGFAEATADLAGALAKYQ